MAGKNNSVNNRQFIGIENLLTCFKLLCLRVYYQRNVSEKNVPKCSRYSIFQFFHYNYPLNYGIIGRNHYLFRY